jgi:16S rRNA (adenine1518-N6/adenine1519-N6)-dimethyltransferase
MVEFEKNPNPTKDQHFLKDKEVLENIISTAGIEEGESIVEIGGGEGALTDYLAEGKNFVTVIEKDPYYAAFLKNRYKDYPNVNVVEGDALAFDYSDYDRLVSNLPYTITEPILVNLAKSGALDYNPSNPHSSKLKGITFLLSQNSLRKMVAPVQITEGNSRHANSEFGLMGAITKSFFDVDIIGAVPSEAFYPEPAVTSFIVKLEPKKEKTTVDRIVRELLMDKRGTSPSIARIYQLMLAQGKVYKVNKYKDNIANVSNTKFTSANILNKNIYELTNQQISQLYQDLTRNDKNIKSRRFNERRIREDDYMSFDEDDYEEFEVKRPTSKYDKKYDYLYDSKLYDVLLNRGLEYIDPNELQEMFGNNKKQEYQKVLKRKQ